MWTFTGGQLVYETSPEPRGPVPEVDTLEDPDKGSGVHLYCSYQKNYMILMPRKGGRILQLCLSTSF